MFVGSGAETDGEDGIAGDSGKCRHVSKNMCYETHSFLQAHFSKTGRVYIDRLRFKYGSLSVKSHRGGSRGFPIYWENGDPGSPFSWESPNVYDIPLRRTPFSIFVCMCTHSFVPRPKITALHSAAYL